MNEVIEKEPTPWEKIDSLTKSLNSELDAAMIEVKEHCLEGYFIVSKYDEESGDVIEKIDQLKIFLDKVWNEHEKLKTAVSERSIELITASVTRLFDIYENFYQVMEQVDSDEGDIHYLKDGMNRMHVRYSDLAKTLERIVDEPEFKFDE